MSGLRTQVGDVFGRLTVMAKVGQRGGRSMCLCTCGNTKIVKDGALLRGETRSCRCLQSELSSKRFLKHGATQGGWSRTYRSWQSIFQRCDNPKHPDFDYYGGRGITVCARWRESFENFRTDMGERPEGMTLDRRDNSKGYGPDNCRWATRTQQSRNSRQTKLEEHEPEQIRWLVAEGLSLRAVAGFFDVSDSLVYAVVKNKAWKASTLDDVPTLALQP